MQIYFSFQDPNYLFVNAAGHDKVVPDYGLFLPLAVDPGVGLDVVLGRPRQIKPDHLRRLTGVALQIEPYPAGLRVGEQHRYLAFIPVRNG